MSGSVCKTLLRGGVSLLCAPRRSFPTESTCFWPGTWGAPRSVRAATSPPECRLGFQVLRGDPFLRRAGSGLRPRAFPVPAPRQFCSHSAPGSPPAGLAFWTFGVASSIAVFSGRWVLRVCTLLCCWGQKRVRAAGRGAPRSVTGPVGIPPTGRQLTWVRVPVSLGRALHSQFQFLVCKGNGVTPASQSAWPGPGGVCVGGWRPLLREQVGRSRPRFPACIFVTPPLLTPHASDHLPHELRAWTGGSTR